MDFPLFLLFSLKNVACISTADNEKYLGGFSAFYIAMFTVASHCKALIKIQTLRINILSSFLYNVTLNSSEK